MDQITPSTLPEPVTLRPLSGKVLTVIVGLIGLVALVAFAVRGEILESLRYTPAVALIVYGCWTLFWYPSVTVEPSGVTVRNPIVTHRVSWPAVRAVDTKYALTLFTSAGKVVSWSAPSPSRYAGMNTTSVELREAGSRDRRPASAPVVRLGDVPKSESGIAALYVRRTWDHLLAQGFLESGAVEGTGVDRRLNVRVLLIASALLVLAVTAILLI